MRIRANGVDFECLSEGTGPLVLLFHGFPDTAHTWSAVRPALAQAGFRAVSPFMRGYHPTGPAPDGRYDTETLGRDILALIEALGEQSAIVVGHDWGAAAAYAAAILGPERVRQLITLAIPHPGSIKPTPTLLWRSRHFVTLKLPRAVDGLRKDDYALVEHLVRRWSPAWKFAPEELAPVKTCFRQPGASEAAIQYYRQLEFVVSPRLRQKIRVPTVAFGGVTDGVLMDLEIYEKARRLFEGPYQVVRMPGGHFLHREHPEQFIASLLEHITKSST